MHRLPEEGYAACAQTLRRAFELMAASLGGSMAWTCCWPPFVAFRGPAGPPTLSLINLVDFLSVMAFFGTAHASHGPDSFGFEGGMVYTWLSRSGDVGTRAFLHASLTCVAAALVLS